MKAKSRMMAMVTLATGVFIAATAQATFSVSLAPDTLNVAPGSPVNVSVNMSDSPGFTMAAINAIIFYDPAVFTYVPPVVQGAFLTGNWDLPNSTGTPAAGELIVGAFERNGGELVAPGNGTLFTFTLLANANAPLGASALTWGNGSFLGDGFGYGDENFADVLVPSTGTSINISAVPEPTTMVAGALLLLPFGASTIRMLRKRQLA
jgi:hypothetical protein